MGHRTDPPHIVESFQDDLRFTLEQLSIFPTNKETAPSSAATAVVRMWFVSQRFGLEVWLLVWFREGKGPLGGRGPSGPLLKVEEINSGLVDWLSGNLTQARALLEQGDSAEETP